MKLKEIILENDLPTSSKKASPGLKNFPDLDNGNVPYLQYRFGLALAASPDIDNDTVGAVGGHLFTLSYTDAEEAKIQAAAKNMGVKSVPRSSRQSSEIDNVNKQSPVKPQGNIRLNPKKKR
jgi:hypothetical protein